MRHILLTLLRFLCFFEWRRYQAALCQPRRTQLKLLSQLIQASTTTQYGQYAGLKRNDSLHSFQTKLGVIGYDEICSYIVAQRSYDQGQICPGRVECFEPTSGSSGQKKWIPYNRPMRRSFTKLFKIWCYDLLRHGPRLTTGSIWYSVSPKLGKGDQPADGFADDTQYIAGPLRYLLRYFLPVDPRVQQIDDPDSFFLVLSGFLLSAEKLEVISIWNPSFFIQILNFISANRPQIIDLLTTQHFQYQDLQFKFAIAPHQLAKIKAGAAWETIWPELKIISCWDSANASMSADELRKVFPHCLIQPKGLLATEAPITVPIIGAQGCLPVLTEVFLEFRDEASQEIKLLDELRDKQCYELIVSQRGGLLRYECGDRVRVAGFYQTLPILEFIGRTGQISDLVGEKLHLDRLKDALAQLNHHPPSLLTPNHENGTFFYRLYVAAEGPNESQLDQLLQTNYHYQHARQLKQLQPLQIIHEPQLEALYFNFCQNVKGMNLGDIKAPGLLKSPDEALSFETFRQQYPVSRSSTPPNIMET
jgi:hypothetical protein